MASSSSRRVQTTGITMAVTCSRVGFACLIPGRDGLRKLHKPDRDLDVIDHVEVVQALYRPRQSALTSRAGCEDDPARVLELVLENRRDGYAVPREQAVDGRQDTWPVAALHHDAEPRAAVGQHALRPLR